MGQSKPGTPNAYYWLNDNELLYLSPMQKVGENEVYRINVHTGPVKTQGVLQSSSLCLSPNGKWALTVTPMRGRAFYLMERTDGNSASCTTVAAKCKAPPRQPGRQMTQI